MVKMPVCQTREEFWNFISKIVTNKDIFAEVETKRKKLYGQLIAGGLSDKLFFEKIEKINSELEKKAIVFDTKEQFKEFLKYFYLTENNFDLSEYNRIWSHEIKHFDRIKKVGMKTNFQAIFFDDGTHIFVATGTLTKENISTWSATKYLKSLIYIVDILDKGQNDKKMILEAKQTIEALKRQQLKK